jgi:hypothetical protein
MLYYCRDARNSQDRLFIFRNLFICEWQQQENLLVALPQNRKNLLKIERFREIWCKYCENNQLVFPVIKGLNHGDFFELLSNLDIIQS